MTLSEIFSAPKPSLQEIANDDMVPSEENETDSQMKETVKQAMAASKAGGEGNAWMRMMNLLMQVCRLSTTEVDVLICGFSS